MSRTILMISALALASSLGACATAPQQVSLASAPPVSIAPKKLPAVPPHPVLSDADVLRLARVTLRERPVDLVEIAKAKRDDLEVEALEGEELPTTEIAELPVKAMQDEPAQDIALAVLSAEELASPAIDVAFAAEDVFGAKADVLVSIEDLPEEVVEEVIRSLNVRPRQRLIATRDPVRDEKLTAQGGPEIEVPVTLRRFKTLD